jgi:hypothetical protein
MIVDTISPLLTYGKVLKESDQEAYDQAVISELNLFIKHEEFTILRHSGLPEDTNVLSTTRK